MARTQDQFLTEVNSLLDEYIDHELVMRNVSPFGGPVHNKRRQLARILYDEYTQNIRPAIPPLNVSIDVRLCAHFITVGSFELRSKNSDAREKGLATLRFIRNKLSRMNCDNRQDMDNCQRLLIMLRTIFDGQLQSPQNSVQSQVASSSTQPQSPQNMANTQQQSATTQRGNVSAANNTYITAQQPYTQTHTPYANTSYTNTMPNTITTPSTNTQQNIDLVSFATYRDSNTEYSCSWR